MWKPTSKHLTETPSPEPTSPGCASGSPSADETFVRKHAASVFYGTYMLTVDRTGVNSFHEPVNPRVWTRAAAWLRSHMSADELFVRERAIGISQGRNGLGGPHGLGFTYQGSRYKTDLYAHVENCWHEAAAIIRVAVRINSPAEAYVRKHSTPDLPRWHAEYGYSLNFVHGDVPCATQWHKTKEDMWQAAANTLEARMLKEATDPIAAVIARATRVQERRVSAGFVVVSVQYANANLTQIYRDQDVGRRSSAYQLLAQDMDAWDKVDYTAEVDRLCASPSWDTGMKKLYVVHFPTSVQCSYRVNGKVHTQRIPSRETPYHCPRTGKTTEWGPLPRRILAWCQYHDREVVK